MIERTEDARPVRALGRSSRRVIAMSFFVLPGLFALACTETRRGLGEECLKGEDCVSNLCVAQVCAAAPPLVQGTPNVPDGSSADGSVENDASDAGELPDSEKDVVTSDDGGDAAD